MFMKNISIKISEKWQVILSIFGASIGLLLIILWVSSHITKTQSQPSYITLKEPQVNLDLFTKGFRSITNIVATGDKNDNRLFITEQSGFIQIVKENGQIESQSFLDISQKVLNNGEMGLLGLVFDPNYDQNGYFYINYINKNQETIIARYKVSSDSNIAESNSEKFIIRIQQPYPNHKGGDLKFGPDGYLYIALGDGGSAGDPDNNAQNKNTLLGKILRVDVNKGDPYAIPPTNPFVNQADVRPEIWAYGLRNPWRISFDKSNNDLYIADVGQGNIEEVNLQKSNSNGGLNYGWRCYEGNRAYNAFGCLSLDNYEPPIFEYDHSEKRCSITGGYVYRGSQYPALNGKYFYGDFCSGQLFYAESKNDTWQQVLALKTDYSFSTFGQDNDNELYVADYNAGNIYKITDIAN